MFPIEFKHTPTREDMRVMYRVLTREYPPTATVSDKQIAKIRRLLLAISLVSGLLAVVLFSLSPIGALLPAAMALVFPIAGFALPRNALKQQQASWDRMLNHPYTDDLWQENTHRFDDQGFSIDGPYAQIRFPWSIVKLVTQSEDRTLLVWGVGNGLVIPDAALPRGIAPEAFADACRQHASTAPPPPNE